MKNLSIIVAMTANGAIGRNGDLLFHISADLRNFKAVTMGHPIIMGRKTFESFPKGALPGRRNMVITRNSAYSAPDIETFPSLHDAISAVADDVEAMVIGGGEIYSQAIALADTLHITEINAIVEDADTFFPAINPNEWTTTETGEWQEDPKTGTKYRFICMSRI
jgi:dihydrofolate reductase